ncbi:hypothetical protein BS78_05G149000 [Paspalum vaginatum]|nr:hypothetical protein BS78_05G149000 [Paspalum vaginatum]
MMAFSVPFEDDMGQIRWLRVHPSRHGPHGSVSLGAAATTSSRQWSDDKKDESTESTQSSLSRWISTRGIAPNPSIAARRPGSERGTGSGSPPPSTPEKLRPRLYRCSLCEPGV